jgi:hypothetical protein
MAIEVIATTAKKGEFVLFDRDYPEKTRMVVEDEMNTEIERLQKRITETDISGDDKALLMWARMNWRNGWEGQELQRMQMRLAQLEEEQKMVTESK